MRAELNPMEIAEHLAKRKELLEARNTGAACTTNRGRRKEFATDTAEKTGKAKRSAPQAILSRKMFAIR